MAELTRAQQLRKRASELRYAAAHAERAGDMRVDMADAADLDREADKLEGIVREVRAPADRASDAEREAKRKASIKRAYGEMEAFFSRGRAQ